MFKCIVLVLSLFLRTTFPLLYAAPPVWERPHGVSHAKESKVHVVLKSVMDVVHGVKAYISRMIKESGAGMKVLLMDKETVRSSH